MALLECRNVSLGYEGKTILSDINFELNGGEYLCVVGENGAGKSTLIKGLLRLKKPMSGEIVTGDGLRPKEIGYLPQQTEAQKDFPASVAEVVLSGRLNSLGARPFYNRADKVDAHDKMRLMGIDGMQNKCYHDLSGGQQQRVLLARALCATRKMLILDEPVSGLDPIVTAELYELIAKINTKLGITVIMVSHDIEAAVRYSSHILHLSHRQVFFGTTKDYLSTKEGRRFVAGEGDEKNA
ncbi:MAG: metal ABC transporter ATP-binding protein [Butyrivibrio sp.]|nr:metal ABC transporter ATP-binding protein [Butyrivibrio sp.]